MAPSTSQGTRDTRPLREKPFQQKCRQEIAAFLSSNGFNITAQAISNLSAKDFRTLYQELVQLLDSNWPFDPVQRFEDQFMQSLKALQYPYINPINVRWLSSPAAMDAWPTLLGVLHWLTEMGKVRRVSNLRASHLYTISLGSDALSSKRRSYIARPGCST